MWSSGWRATCRRSDVSRCSVALALALASCVPLYRDRSLSLAAQREWLRSGADAGAISLRWDAWVCVGLPGAFAWGDGTGTVLIPWPWDHVGPVARATMRYEMSRVAWVHRSPVWLLPLAYADAVLHGPACELWAWWHALGGGYDWRGSR